MLLKDYLILILNSVLQLKLRSLLTGLGIAVGVASVLLLTAIGAGVHRFVLTEFTQFGTNLIGIAPGKTTTAGISGAIISNVRPLSLEDADALRRIPQIKALVPLIQGNAAVEYGGLNRRVNIFGVNHEVPQVWQIQVTQGRFLPQDDIRKARAFAVLGSKLKNELFTGQNPLGALIRIGGQRFRVIGVMESKGQLLGFDLDDSVYIPVVKSMEMFNREGLMEIDILYGDTEMGTRVAAASKKILLARHGEEDFTVTTQEEMLDTLGAVLNILTFVVAALGGISLLVGAIGILTIMTISVKERTAEIGLLRAIGAKRRHILGIFMGEAIILAGLGGLAGLILGAGSALLLHVVLHNLPVHISWTYVLLAELLALVIGVCAGLLPARHAAYLDPIEALRAE